MRKIRYTGVTLQRRQRSSRIGYELHHYAGYGFFHFWIGSPTVHRWWAFSFYIYFQTGPEFPDPICMQIEQTGELPG